VAPLWLLQATDLHARRRAGECVARRRAAPALMNGFASLGSRPGSARLNTRYHCP
jgi:hypothetical protein